MQLNLVARRRLHILPTTGTLLFLVGGFATLIGVGTGLLLLPFAHEAGVQVSFRTALFTATSAACVTGLTVVETATTWTGFGQAVLAFLMFTGGLGIMTAGVLLLLSIGRRLTLANKLVLQEPIGATTLGDVATLGVQVFVFAVAVQAAGALFLFFRFLFLFPAGQAAWQAVFHSVSAFNNAGFFIAPGGSSLKGFQEDYWVLLIIAVLVILGSISFIVLADIARGRRFNRLRLDTRMVVIGSISLWVLGSIVTFLFEHQNPATLGALPVADQAANAVFQSVSGRTAGFSSIEFGLTRPATDFFYMLLMFIGGATASTAGGIKINTAMVLLAAAWAASQGRSHPGLLKRELPYGQVARAVAILILALAAIFGGVMALTVLENASLESSRVYFLDLMFESFSAFGTVGLSTGVTSELTEPSQYVLATAMYLGRLGPLTLALGLAMREKPVSYRYGEERVRIG